MQKYQLVIRGLTKEPTVLSNGQVDTQNVGEFLSYLEKSYLSQGYTIQKVELVRYIPTDGVMSKPAVYEFAYHLVKEIVLTSDKPIKVDK